jgi:hypothetical protein
MASMDVNDIAHMRSKLYQKTKHGETVTRIVVTP